LACEAELDLRENQSMTTQKFRTHIRMGQSKNVTGIEVPPDVIIGLGGGQRPRVKVQVNAYTYVSSVAKMGERFMISLSAAHREAAGLVGGQAVEVSLELEAEPAAIDVPDDLSSALRAAGLDARFSSNAPSRRKEWVRQVEDAKTRETRVRRIEKVVGALAD
jgi:uncharacterized protein YdeI (YjbR/CyaY-like superfamily)